MDCVLMAGGSVRLKSDGVGLAKWQDMWKWIAPEEWCHVDGNASLDLAMKQLAEFVGYDWEDGLVLEYDNIYRNINYIINVDYMYTRYR